MTTIKSYTDLQQSKMLAEILPLESADAFYIIGEEPVNIVVIYGFVTHKHLKEQIAYKRAIPCWSLTALLEILPAECECMSLEHINYGNNHKKYFMSYIGGENTEDYDNPIDACVDMIEKLHELNLL